ncbi:unnamed protein product [Diamesa serratosioi]
MSKESECSEQLDLNITKEKCCSHKLAVGYTETPVDDWTLLLNLAGKKKSFCASCGTRSCEGFKCGTGQRCIMKRGMPKCVCAPNCKAPPKKQPINKNNNHIRVEYMQQKTKNLERQTNNERHKRRHKIEMQNDAPAQISIPINKTPTNIKTTNHHSFKKKTHSTPSNNNSNFLTSNDVNIDDAEMFKDFVEYRIRSGSWNKRNNPKTTSNDFDRNNKNHPKEVAVCGADNKTYKNECQLKKRACRQENPNLVVAYKGHCQNSCKFMSCSNDESCMEDQNSNPHCIDCSVIKCKVFSANVHQSRNNQRICGTDGVTYESTCEAVKHSCMLGITILKAYDGPCNETSTCENTKCPQKHQICLRDLLSNKPQCQMCSYKCSRLHQSGIDAIKNKENKICGRNDHTYLSECHMKKDSCKTGFYIGVKHKGACNTSRVDV